MDRTHGPDFKANAFAFDAALLFVDISGFSNLSTKVAVDPLQRHINDYFGKLIREITEYGGDVLRFAGDAILCAWEIPPRDERMRPLPPS